MDERVLNDAFPDDAITLEILAEEAAEIIQAKSKIIRFGLLDKYNEIIGHEMQTNREKLETEIMHLLAVIDVLKARGIIKLDPVDVDFHKNQKWLKMQKWNAYQGEKGETGI